MCCLLNAYVFARLCAGDNLYAVKELLEAPRRSLTEPLREEHEFFCEQRFWKICLQVH